MSSAIMGTALVTGASTGIGAVYAERLARRGHDLVLVARDADRLNGLAEALRAQTGIKVDVLRADLTRPVELARVEARLAEDPSISILVNNAGAVGAGTFLDQTPDDASRILALNVLAVTRLASAAAPAFVERRRGAIVNIASVLGFAPEMGMTVYGATKAFVIALSQGLAIELGPKGIYVQAVLPAATRTEIWERSGRNVDAIPGVMDAGALVDAALVGFDRRETVTIPPLPDVEQWQAYEAARRAMLPNLRQSTPAQRYIAA
jgi:short-subunit dehydrogenase